MINQLPCELWEGILLKVDGTKDLKNVSLVCQMFNGIVKEILWNAPKLKNGLSLEQLSKLQSLPIKAIDTGNIGKLDCAKRGADAEKWLDVICSFPQLTTLKLGWNIDLNFRFIGKIATLKNLKSLTLERLYAGISKALGQIERLQLESFSIEDLIFHNDIEPISKMLGKMSSLKKLEIQTNDVGAKHLGKLTNLEKLIIRESDLDKTALQYLGKLPSLKHIKFCDCEDTSKYKSILKEINSSLKLEIEGGFDGDNDYDYYDYECDYDYDDEDLPPGFIDNYNELGL